MQESVDSELSKANRFLDDGANDVIEELTALSLISSVSERVLPSIKDAQGYSDVEDSFLRRYRSGEIRFLSELGSRYAASIERKMELAFWGNEVAFSDPEYDFMPIPLSNDRGRSSTSYIPAEVVASDDSAEAALFNSKQFQDFMSSEFGIARDDIKEGDLYQFLKWATSADAGGLDQLKDAIAKSTDKKLLFDVFLATEFGDDYGDSIVSIAGNANKNEAAEIFETVARFRARTHEFASWFRDYDSDFAKATERAMNERLTDALVALDAVAAEGSLHVDVAPHRRTAGYENDGRFMCDVASLEDGIEIIRQLDKSMGLIHDVITSQDVRVSRVNENSEQFVIYRFSSGTHGEALLYIRPEGAKGYDKAYEYGNKKGIEASISFIVNPKNPHHLRSDKDPDGVSIRFDREGRLSDDSPFAKDRDPTKENGTISVDISSGLGDPSRMPVKIGRFIAAGNILRAQRTGSHESLHHNTNHFDQSRYGKASGFANLAIYSAHMAEAMLYLQSQGSHRSRYKGLPGVLRREDVELAA